MTFAVGRADLDRWRAEARRNWFDSNPNLLRVLRRRAGEEAASAMAGRLRSFAQVLVDVVEPAVAEVERNGQLPAAVPYDGVGNLVAEVEFHPAQRRARQAVWASGLVGAAAGGDAGLAEPAAMFYLLSHVGEGGVASPLVCTVGLARALAHRGSEELRRRYLPGMAILLGKVSCASGSDRRAGLPQLLWGVAGVVR